MNRNTRSIFVDCVCSYDVCCKPFLYSQLWGVVYCCWHWRTFSFRNVLLLLHSFFNLCPLALLYQVPAQPSSFEAEAELDTRIMLTWLWPVQDPITKYELQYWEAGSDNKVRITTWSHNYFMTLPMSVFLSVFVCLVLLWDCRQMNFAFYDAISQNGKPRLKQCFCSNVVSFPADEKDLL